jgi:hypothetical protein
MVPQEPFAVLDVVPQSNVGCGVAANPFMPLRRPTIGKTGADCAAAEAPRACGAWSAER